MLLLHLVDECKLPTRNSEEPIFIICIWALIFVTLYQITSLYYPRIYKNFCSIESVALLLSPIMTFIAALGVNLLLKSQGHNKSKYKYLAIFILFSLFIFSSISNSFTAQDNPILAQEKEIPTPYFSQSDLNLRQFVEKMNVSNVYADQILVKSFPSTLNLKSIEAKKNDPIVLPHSYIVIRYREFRERCLRITTGERSIWDEEVKYYNEKDFNIKKNRGRWSDI